MQDANTLGSQPLIAQSHTLCIAAAARRGRDSCWSPSPTLSGGCVSLAATLRCGQPAPARPRGPRLRSAQPWHLSPNGMFRRSRPHWHSSRCVMATGHGGRPMRAACGLIAVRARARSGPAAGAGCRGLAGSAAAAVGSPVDADHSPRARRGKSTRRQPAHHLGNLPPRPASTRCAAARGCGVVGLIRPALRWNFSLLRLGEAPVLPSEAGWASR